MAMKKRIKSYKTSNGINWFGSNNLLVKKPTNTFSSGFSFLGGGESKYHKAVPFLSTPQNNSNRTISSTMSTLNVLSPSPLFKKESTKSKHLSKWGDADLDGSPNWLDCDPRNVRKDKKGVKKKATFMYGPEVYQSKSILSRIKEITKKKPKEMLSDIKESVRKKPSSSKMFVERDITSLERSGDIKKYNKEMRKIREDIEKKDAEAMALMGPLTKEQSDKLFRKRIEKIREKQALYSSQNYPKHLLEDPYRKDIETRERLQDKASKKYGLQGRLELQKYQIQQKIKAGQGISQKEIARLKQLEKASKVSTRIKKGIKETMGESLLPTASVVGEGGKLTKAARAKAARIRSMTIKGAQAAYGDSILQRGGFGSEQSFRSKGRPSGPSGRYSIKGRPVYEQEYQDYMTKQNALNRVLPSEAQQASLNPEFVQQQLAQQEMKNAPQESQVQFVEGQDEMTPEQLQTIQQDGQVMVQRDSRYRQGPTMDEIRIAQQRAQKQDNILHAPRFAKVESIMFDDKKDNIMNAPNIMKGEMQIPEEEIIQTELKDVDVNIFDRNEGHILDAPDVFKGQMRNVVPGSKEIPTTHLSERPQSNPYGDSYLDIELASGKPMIKKRTSEKWYTGEAL